MNEEIMKINCLITFFCRCRIKTRRKKSLVNARLICDNRLFLIFVFLCYLFSIESKRKRKVRVQQLVEWHEYRYIYIFYCERMNFKKKESNQFASSSSSITWPRFDRCDQINSCVYLHSMAHERAFQLRYELFSL